METELRASDLSLEMAQPESQSRTFVSQVYFFPPCYSGPCTKEYVVLDQATPSEKPLLVPDPGETAANRINKHCSVYMDVFVLRGKDK